MSTRLRAYTMSLGVAGSLLACSAVAASGQTTIAAGPSTSAAQPGVRAAPAMTASASPSATAGASVLPGTVAPSAFRRPAERPNILLVTMDDASVADLAYMPRLQRLVVRQGTSFDGVAPTPICVPARASILTGQYAHNHGSRTIFGAHGGFRSFDDSATLPVWLRKAGYDTLFVGKYLNDYGYPTGSTRYVPPGWTDWRGSLDGYTYDFSQAVLNVNGSIRSFREYQTNAFAGQIDKMLRDPRRTRKPWFMWANYVAPHHGAPIESDDPLADGIERVPTPMPAKRDRNTFSSLPLPSTPDMFVVPRGAPADSPSRTRWRPRLRDAVREGNQQRIESLQSVDRALAGHLRSLRRTGQLERTLVVVTSDNGFAVGQHNRYHKLWGYQDMLRIPIIMRGPTIPRGQVSETTVTNADLPVTFARLARARIGREVDGANVLAHVRGRTQGVRVIPLEAWPVTNGRKRLWSGIRVGSWTYMRYRKGGEELFDTRSDPYQLRNLAPRPAYADQLAEMRSLKREYLECRGTSCPQTFYR